MSIVVVAFNYRVGLYGFFLASAEVQEHASLNNGLKDQIKAPNWVQEHIGKVWIPLTLFSFSEVHF